jgi:hypothetical protein
MLPDKPDQGAGARDDAPPALPQRPYSLEREQPDESTEFRRQAFLATMISIAEPHERPATMLEATRRPTRGPRL